MDKPDIPKADRERFAQMLRAHLDEECDLELGRFEAEALLDFVSALVRPHHYNRGLLDAQALMARQMDLFNDAVHQMEMDVR